MNHARPILGMLVGGLAASLVVGTVGISAAEAKPPAKPGAITGLSATVTPGDLTYGLASSWDPVANATGYRTTLTKGGTALASTTVKSPSWSTTLNTSPGKATLSVQAVVRHRKGRVSTFQINLLDVTRPNGAFSTSWDNSTGWATLTQDGSLTDDSPVGEVVRTVNWHDGSPEQPWSTGTTLDHAYTLTPAQQVTFYPTVTLTDLANNTRVIDVAPIVFNDSVKPTGSFGVFAAKTTWAKLTQVTVKQSSLADNRTLGSDIARTVDWGDSSPLQTWTVGTTISHVYGGPGTFVPVVTAEDQAHNVAEFDLSAVTVKADLVAPLVKLLLPKTHKHSVKVWSLLRGKATDTAGTGVKQVRLRAVEKRGTKWFGYRPATKRWVRSATKAMAFKRSRAFTLTTTTRHRWSARVAGLRRGTLVYKVWAVDRVRNGSRPLTHKATLTKP